MSGVCDGCGADIARWRAEVHRNPYLPHPGVSSSGHVYRCDACYGRLSNHEKLEWSPATRLFSWKEGTR